MSTKYEMRELAMEMISTAKACADRARNGKLNAGETAMLLAAARDTFAVLIPVVGIDLLEKK